jgi:hypothetical protein
MAPSESNVEESQNQSKTASDGKKDDIVKPTKGKIHSRGITINRESMGLGPDDPIPHSVSEQAPWKIQQWKCA